MQVKDLKFVVFDLETTGLEVNEGAEIIEIGAVKFSLGALQDCTQFESFVKPEKLIPPDATRVNGITNEMVFDSPGIDIVFPQFQQFCKGSVLVAQNAKFDVSFLLPLLQKHEIENFQDFCVDTKLLSRKIWFYERGHNLDTIAARLSIPYDSKTRHRSIADCKITAECLEQLIERTNTQSIQDLKKFSVPIPKPVIENQPFLPLFS